MYVFAQNKNKENPKYCLIFQQYLEFSMLGGMVETWGLEAKSNLAILKRIEILTSCQMPFDTNSLSLLAEEAMRDSRMWV